MPSSPWESLLVPFGSSNYLIDVLTSAFLYAILATALNITVGLTGVLVLGFIGFYAIGAYTTGILTAKFALCNFWVALPLSGLTAMLCGVLLGIPTLRLKGDYLAIVTLGFGEIVKIFLNNLDLLPAAPTASSASGARAWDRQDGQRRRLLLLRLSFFWRRRSSSSPGSWILASAAPGSQSGRTRWRQGLLE